MTQKAINLLSAFICGVSLQISSCSSTAPQVAQATQAEAQRLEKSVTAESLRKSPATARRDIEKALRLYTAIDNIQAEIATHFKMVRLELAEGNRKAAQQRLMIVTGLITEETPRDQQFTFHLLSGRSSNTLSHFQQAYQLAKSKLDKGLVLTYMERNTEAYEMIKTIGAGDIKSQDDLAFINYRYARKENHLAAALQALKHYKAADNHTGIADSLFLTALIYQQNGDRKKSRHYMNRALLVSRAIDDNFRVNAIKKAIEAI